MKIMFENKEELASYYKFIVKTSQDALRLEKAWHMFLTNYKGDGCMGCINEILTATSHSKKAHVSNAGKHDCYIKFRTADGKIIPVPCERKTNGGRIQSFESEFSKAEKMTGRYVIYSMDVCNSGTNYVRRHVDPVVIPMQLFIDKLYEFNAVKAINKGGELNGFGIQVTCKPLYLWLCDWPVVYDRDAVYTDEDFEGLEQGASPTPLYKGGITMYKLIKTEDARNGKAMLKNELELAKKELEEWEERDCTLCYRSKRAEWDGNSDLYELLEEPLLEAVSKCRALREEIEAIEEALEALEAYEQAIEYLETVWNEQG